jgi:hypothetical protein
VLSARKRRGRTARRRKTLRTGHDGGRPQVFGWPNGRGAAARFRRTLLIADVRNVACAHECGDPVQRHVSCANRLPFMAKSEGVCERADHTRRPAKCCPFTNSPLCEAESLWEADAR